MCGGMVDIQSLTAEIRRGKKEERRKKQDENIMVCFIPMGDHNDLSMGSLVSIFTIGIDSVIPWPVHSVPEKSPIFSAILDPVDGTSSCLSGRRQSHR